MSRVYVGTLDPNVTKEQLEDEARAFGKVEDIWIARNPPGFAFITYEDLRDAEDAVQGMAGKRIGEQEVRVELAKNRGGGSAGPRGNYGGGDRGGCLQAAAEEEEEAGRVPGHRARRREPVQRRRRQEVQPQQKF